MIACCFRNVPVSIPTLFWVWMSVMTFGQVIQNKKMMMTPEGQFHIIKICIFTNVDLIKCWLNKTIWVQYSNCRILEILLAVTVVGALLGSQDFVSYLIGAFLSRCWGLLAVWQERSQPLQVWLEVKKS